MDVLTGCPSEVSARLQTPFNLQLNVSHWYYLSMKSVNGYLCPYCLVPLHLHTPTNLDSTEICMSIRLVLLCLFSHLSNRHRASLLKNEQSFNCFWKDSDAASIAVSLGKGPATERQLFSTLPCSQFPAPSHVRSMSTLHSRRSSVARVYL